MKQRLYEVLTNHFITETMFEDQELDELLDEREIEEFEKQWLKCYEEIKQLEHKIQGLELIDKIREEAFRKTDRRREDSDLAGYVSDDFELFSKAIELNYHNEWLDGLFESYVLGKFPCGENVEKSDILIVKRLEECF